MINIILGPKHHKASGLLDSRASAYFLHEEFAKRYSILLLKKTKHIHIEDIDGHLLSSRNVTHEIILIEVTSYSYISFLIINIIRSLSNLIIFDL